MKIEFSERLKAGIAHVAQDCAGDLSADFSEEEAGCSFEIVLAETALDASRLTMWGYPDADQEASALVKQHGYDAVLKAAAELVYG